MDKHSNSKPDQAIIEHLHLSLNCDFDKKILKGFAEFNIKTDGKSSEIILDTRDLTILKVSLDADTNSVAFALGAPDEILGSALTIKIKPETKKVKIEYQTSPEAGALQWLSPSQTAGGKTPFLFTQSQAILARTWIPVQDSPGIRFTYDAEITVPIGMLALMSAENPQKKSADGKYTFSMKQPVPAYLMALAAGDIEFTPFDNRTGVYAEPVSMKASAYEFAETGKMLEAAEKLYGKYAWDRYDILVLPPSFPFGGMENPRLTFATPTVIAGDRSLTSLIAHEMAHSWSGNLVTNSTWDDFWLNEGFTVYFERRIMEEMYGPSYAEMLAQLGYEDLNETLAELKADNHWDDTRLKLDLSGRDPDDGVSDIAYEKGYFLLRTIEHEVGRAKMDAFLNQYFDHFAFKGANTDQFLEFLYAHLFAKNSAEAQKIQPEEWIFKPGLPSNIFKPNSERFTAVKKQAEDFKSGKSPKELVTKDWTSHEWQYFIRSLPNDIGVAKMHELDLTFHFTESGNSEIAALWFELAIKNNYADAIPNLEKFLMKVGRRKFLKPLYEAMNKSEAFNARALEIYKKARPGYHSVSTKTLDEMLGFKP